VEQGGVAEQRRALGEIGPEMAIIPPQIGDHADAQVSRRKAQAVRRSVRIVSARVHDQGEASGLCRPGENVFVVPAFIDPYSMARDMAVGTFAADMDRNILS